VKSRTAAEGVPTFVTAADDPAAPVVTVPTVTVADVPFWPGSPSSPCKFNGVRATAQLPSS
jgi:hypothetical protein